MRHQSHEIAGQAPKIGSRPSAPGRKPRVAASRLAAVATLFLLAVPASRALAAFTADLSGGDVSIKAEATPDRVSPAEDLMLTLTVDAPSHLAVTLPDLRDRFAGFSTVEDYAVAPVEANGRTRQTFRWRLTPQPAATRYRLAPFAVATLDKRSPAARPSTFATRPVVFPPEAPRPAVTGDPEVAPQPEWIRPTAKTVALWIFAALAGAALLAAALYGLTRLSRRVREFRMSPVERAMAELERLLGRNLPGRGLYKEFYIELTMVVRRYIERSHGVRAPEQTTQEFLAAAAGNPAFTRDVLAQLRTFLESADLVKFAGQEASLSMATDATAKARAYIETDATVVSSTRIGTGQPAPTPVDSSRGPHP